ncbi:MBL fold metallo-hydrolase [Nocardia sp. NPDC049220]|uniref:MBL fold metallo-hydrolase n=1 Tax=Nocardia sp. NPDC049220 TaxID=3155273 RepID=UPI0033F8FFB6
MAASERLIPSGVALRWWGNNSWEIRLPGGKTVLIDPWLTRFHTGTYSAEGADPETPIVVDTALIDRYVDGGELRADHILVTHGHYDHLTDVPYLAKKTGATVLGTETHLNLLAALGAPENQLTLATGGEFLHFGDYSIRVLRSLHSASGPRAGVAFAGTRPGLGAGKLPEPKVIRDLVEGGTLAYEVRGGGVSVLDFGGSNYIESELAGLRPDVLLLPAGGGKIEDYVARLLRVTGNPRYVIPTHWDDFDYPLAEPARDWGGLEALRTAVAAASPRSTFVTVDHLQTFTP